MGAVHLKPDLTIRETDLDGIVDNLNRCTFLNLVNKPGDILVVHPETAMADRHAHTKLLVGAVDQIAFLAQQQGVGTKRIPGARRNHTGQVLT